VRLPSDTEPALNSNLSPAVASHCPQGGVAISRLRGKAPRRASAVFHDVACGGRRAVHSDNERPRRRLRAGSRRQIGRTFSNTPQLPKTIPHPPMRGILGQFLDPLPLPEIDPLPAFASHRPQARRRNLPSTRKAPRRAPAVFHDVACCGRRAVHGDNERPRRRLGAGSRRQIGRTFSNTARLPRTIPHPPMRGVLGQFLDPLPLPEIDPSPAAASQPSGGVAISRLPALHLVVRWRGFMTRRAVADVPFVATTRGRDAA
jgi:hypothetical protein